MDAAWFFASAEVFDSASGSFTATGSMTTPREDHTATLLSNGKVLVAGGSSSTTAELYDPVSRTFVATGAMITIRSYHSATLLAKGNVLTNGKVLIAGGTDNSGPLATAELYDPVNETFTATGSMTTPREFHTATLLPNGKVLIAGGTDASGPLATAELFDPASGAFTAAGNLNTPRAGHTAVALLNGLVLIAGGADVNNFGLPGFTAELFDPVSGTFTLAGSMISSRSSHTATLLQDGRVLVTGGFIDDAFATATAELYK